MVQHDEYCTVTSKMMIVDTSIVTVGNNMDNIQSSEKLLRFLCSDAMLLYIMCFIGFLLYIMYLSLYKKQQASRDRSLIQMRQFNVLIYSRLYAAIIRRTHQLQRIALSNKRATAMTKQGQSKHIITVSACVVKHITSE